MGYAQRAREAAEQLAVNTYRVRVWTDFEWDYPEGDTKAARELRDGMHKDNIDHLKRAAGIVGRRLVMLVQGRDCQVKQVSVKKEPQLMFELTVDALDKDDARRRAVYRFGRALDIKIPTGIGRPKASLRPTWGQVEVELQAK